MLSSATGFTYFAASAFARFGSVIEPTTANANSLVRRVRIAA